MTTRRYTVNTLDAAEREEGVKGMTRAQRRAFRAKNRSKRAGNHTHPPRAKRCSVCGV